ncbi:PQQ-binding-like beta-propeller repeat protein [Natronococcus sp. JC468]|nr:PQQ-binding-like beta-propeller repeat protein [Natronococcus sp. JC468]
MADWQRRSVLATGATLSAGGILASIGSGAASSQDDDDSFEGPSGWSSYGANTGNSRYVPTENGFSSPDRIDWQYEESGSLVATSEMVFLRTGEGVHALDAESGTCAWTCEKVHATGTPAVGNGTVYVVGSQLTAIDAESGEVQWSEQFGDEASTSEPVAAFGSVYVTVDGALYAFAEADGSLQWKCESVGVTPKQGGADEIRYVFSTRASAVVAVDNTVWALLDGRASEGSVDADAVVAFDPQAGTTRRADQLNDGDFAAGLAATDEALFVENSGEEGVTGLENGTDCQRFVSDALTTAAVGSLSVTRGRYELKMTGPESSWCKTGAHSYGPPAIIDGTVVVAHSNPGSSDPDKIVGYCLEDGCEEWCFTFDDTQWNDGFNEECIVTEDAVYVSRDEGLTALCPHGKHS